MNKSYSILHLSDLHYDKTKEKISPLLVNNIFNDIKALEDQEKLNIRLIIFTGDLVNFGGQKELYKEAYDNIIKPLLDKLELNKQDFIYIPGNHELDREKVNKDFQAGFISRILNADIDTEDFGNEFLTQRSKNFFDFISNFYKWDNNEVIKNVFVNVEGHSIGISLYNTAWCSSTFSDEDRKRILMPPVIAKQKLQELDYCDFKIAIMHHPIDWYQDENADRIQHVLSQYNLVLCGHKHLESNKLEQKGPLKTIYNYAHKLLPLEEKESGYSIIKLVPNENKLQMFYREFNDKLNTYCTGLTNVEQDRLNLKYSEYEIGSDNQDLQVCYKIFSAIKNNFIANLDNLFVTNTLEGNKKSFDNLFVGFSLSEHPTYSEPTKESSKKEENKIYHLEDLAERRGVVNVYGKKESGKTVLTFSLAKYFLDNFEKYKKIPIVLNCKKLCRTNVNIIKAISDNIYDLLNEDSEVTKKDVSILIEKGLFILICDEPSFLTQKQLKEIDSLKVDKYNVNDYNPLVFGDDDKAYIENEINNEKKNFFIKPYSKNDVRKLVNNVSLVDGDNKYVENVITYFYTTSLPRTPFVISLIATICSRHKDTIPTNQAKILEQFLENVLEKINPIEQLSRTYDFSNKEDYLSCFAFKLYELNSFSMSHNEYIQFTLDYHKERGFSLEDSKFDKIFFEKNILVKDGNIVYFRFSCFNYYYLAKYAIKNSKFKDHLVENNNITENAEILFYYTGLKRDDSKLLESVTNRLNQYITAHPFDGDIFDQDPIKTNLGLTDEFVESIKQNRVTIKEEEKDEITDRGDKSNDYDPQKQIIKRDEQPFDRLLSILGFSIKNCEEVSADKKIQGMKAYLRGCYILWDNFREKLLQFAREFNDLFIKDNDNVDEQLKKAYEIFEDILKISIPVAISQSIMENTATEKMKNIYQDLLGSYDYNSPEKLFLTFLLVDLNYRDSEKILKDFVKNTNNKNYLMVCLVKLLYTYLFGPISNNTKLLNPIADCYIKATNSSKNQKGKIIESVKKKEFYDKFLLEDSQNSKK